VPPTVQISASYPGAAAQVIEQTVAAPLEHAINGVEHMLYMASSATSDGNFNLTVTFEIGTNADQAVMNVNNLVKAAEMQLPVEVRRQGVAVIKGSSALLQVLAVYSPEQRYDSLYLSNYVTLNLLDRLKRIPGSANVQVFGAQDYAMRVWVRPDRMAQLGVTMEELSAAIGEQNAEFAAGKVGQAPTGAPQDLVYTIASHGGLVTPEQFGDIIVRADPNGGALRLRDLARIELGSKNNDLIGRVDGKPAVLIGVYLQPGANALDVGAAVAREMTAAQRRFPPGLAYKVPYDTTRFVQVSMREVLKTLAEAMVLVFLVVYLFLQNLRATVIPILAVPVSLLGTFAGLHLLGYSINTLTLFGMVLAIGIVVDDAIVVLENIERIMHEQGRPVRAAALQAMREVSGPVVAIVLALCAVFVPVAFLGGLTGELYRQFAITLSIAVVLSGVVALTMTPALCVALLGHERRAPARPFRHFNQAFARLTAGYMAGVAVLLRRSLLGALLFGAMVLATVGLFLRTPGSLVPDEDQGYYIVGVFLPEGAALARTDAVVQQVTQLALAEPSTQNVVAFSGRDFLGGGFRNSAATLFVTQKHWDERQVTTKELVAGLLKKTGAIPQATVVAFTPPSIFGLGSTGGFEFYLQNPGAGGPQRLAAAMRAFFDASKRSPVLGGRVKSLWHPLSPQLLLDVDRERAKALGVRLDTAFAAMAGTFGTYYVNNFNQFGHTWQVLISADGAYRRRPEDINGIYVKSTDGHMVALSAFARVSYVARPDSLDHFNGVPAVKLLGSAAPGYASGAALAEIERIAGQALPADMNLEWSGTSFQERRNARAAYAALGMAALMVLLILAAQYEQWLLPLAIMLAMPLGLFGALVAVNLRHYSNDVYFQIGLVTLLGLSAKNAILIVEYAVLKQREGHPVAQAAIEAARLRFRPIVMTSLAFILGVAPLALSHGAGAGARNSLGTGVLGGMLAATFLAIYFVPLFFRWLSRPGKERLGAVAVGEPLKRTG
jgi:hydrophobe/amphiphile efflux-1 (HAE1) family protein